MKTWLITGCSSGLGRSIAHKVLEQGDQAAVTAQKPEVLCHESVPLDKHPNFNDNILYRYP